MTDGLRGRKISLLAVLVLLSLVVASPTGQSIIGLDAQELRGDDPEAVQTVSPQPNATVTIWPYTSSAHSTASATLPINLVVLADASVVQNVLVTRPDATWENQTGSLNGSTGSADEGELVPTAVNATGVYWSEAEGAKRYTYVRAAGSREGRWIDETFQLHDGDYFGTRYHVRFYEVPDGENTYTALQAHREHFDWLRLRHTVDSLPRSQHYVETQFYDRWYVADLQKRRFSDGDVLRHDGWVTVVQLRADDVIRGSMSLAVLPLGVVAAVALRGFRSSLGSGFPEDAAEGSPIRARTLLAALVIASIPLLVRVAGIAVEQSGIVSSPKVVAGTFYPFVTLGPPVAAYLLFRGVDPGEAFVAAFLALGVGFLLDYAYLDIATLPIGVVVHRAYLMLALGFVAAVGADPADGNRTVVVASLWAAGILWALFWW